MTMASRKKGGRKTTVRRARGTAEVLRETWASTVAALGSAEAEVQKQIKGLLKRNRIGARDAATVLKQLGARVDRERKKALKQLEARLGPLQARVQQEGKVVGRRVGQAVKGGLAAFNIPSRQEVNDLTRKVEELSRKIDAFKRRR
jgi:hypothetical protein